MSIHDQWYISGGDIQPISIQEGLENEHTFIVSNKDEEAELRAYAMLLGHTALVKVMLGARQYTPDLKHKDGVFTFYLTQYRGRDDRFNFIPL
ncbi:hypothetical protein [Burkholderia phage vB_BpP_HN03]|uniref:Uncharacterized protein n=1 Tax=Burkholderia phage vB_BpP_HN02 TaxID=3116925 RepID=A0AAX4JGZ2_9CAUD|nr:hypothetical protein [Burkholderia phage vB_BpP_HN01]